MKRTGLSFQSFALLLSFNNFVAESFQMPSAAFLPRSSARSVATSALFSAVTPEQREPASVSNVYQDATRLLNAMDEDQNGVISREELSSMLKPMGYSAFISESLFEALDANKDQELSHEELVEAMIRYSPLYQPLALGSSELEDQNVSDLLDREDGFLSDLYEDVNTAFSTAVAHGNGRLSPSALKEHLQLRTDNPLASAAIDSIMELLYLDENSEDTSVMACQEDVTHAFLRYNALRQALSESMAL